MASFEKAIVNTFKAEGGFENDKEDNANFVNGVCIGTNRGISAQAYYAYYKKVPTEQQMRDFTVEQAMQIFKGNYWDKVACDYIVNQSVAELMFQFIIGSGQGQISDIKDIANKTNGKVVLVSNDIALTKMDANFINGLNQSLFFKGLWDFRLAFYDRVVANNPAKMKYLKGWQNRLNTHKFIA